MKCEIYSALFHFSLALFLIGVSRHSENMDNFFNFLSRSFSQIFRTLATFALHSKYDANNNHHCSHG